MNSNVFSSQFIMETPTFYLHSLLVSGNLSHYTLISMQLLTVVCWTVYLLDIFRQKTSQCLCTENWLPPI